MRRERKLQGSCDIAHHWEFNPLHFFFGDLAGGEVDWKGSHFYSEFQSDRVLLQKPLYQRHQFPPSTQRLVEFLVEPPSQSQYETDAIDTRAAEATPVIVMGLPSNFLPRRRRPNFVICRTHFDSLSQTVRPTPVPPSRSPMPPLPCSSATPAGTIMRWGPSRQSPGKFDYCG